jgi:hypothetical protein
MKEVLSTKDLQMDESAKTKLENIHKEFEEIVNEKGATIRNVVRVTRNEKMHYLLEDADFSRHRIIQLVREGELDCENALKKSCQEDNQQKQPELPEEEENEESQISPVVDRNNNTSMQQGTR